MPSEHDLDVIETEVIEIEEQPGTELAVVQAHPTALVPADTPAQYVERVTEIADALAAIIEKKRLFSNISGKKFVNVEGWTTLGSLMGVFGQGVYAVPDGDPEWVEIDGVKGVKATMKAITADGRVIGGGYGVCMRNEKKWRNADFYAMSGMAQTRATSRALRQPLGFIVKLAGYEATPSEERGGDDDEPVARAEDTRRKPDLLARVRTGMKALEPQPAWTEGAILRQAKLLWGSEAERLDDLRVTDLEAILAAMTDAGAQV